MTDLGQLPGPHDTRRPSATTLIWTPVFDWDKEGWREQAACRDADVELFFPVGNTGLAADKIQAAKVVCRSCPVREACLQFAFETKQEAGIWGGTDEDERRRLRRTWRAGRQRLPRSINVLNPEVGRVQPAVVPDRIGSTNGSGGPGSTPQEAPMPLTRRGSSIQGSRRTVDAVGPG